MAAVFLAAKQEENLLSVREIFNVFVFITAHHYGDEFRVPEYFSETFYRTRDQVYISEMEILKALGFQTNVNLPYSLAINYLKVLDILSSDLAQSVCNYINDALWTKLYCIYPPPVLACMAIYLAARNAGVYLPHDWPVVFDVERTDMCTCAAWMGVFYHIERKREASRRAAVSGNTGTIVPLDLKGLEMLLKGKT
jgi:hypothetical protein